MKHRFLRLGMLCVFSLLMASTAMAGALHEAVKKGDIQQVRQLIAQGADVNAPDKKRGISPLFYGVYQTSKLALAMANPAGKRNEKKYKGLKGSFYNALNVVKLLIKHGADVNARNKWGETPLFAAYTRAVAKLLIAQGADVNAKDHKGKTPLFNTRYKDQTVVELLIHSGADVNAKDHKGKTPLFWNITSNAKLLIDNGADVNARDKWGRTPLYKNMSLLLSAPGHPHEKDIVANATATIKLLIASGADVMAGKRGDTPLHLAAALQYADVAKLLIARGADVKARTKEGRTPMHNAASIAVAKLLIAKGADINARIKSGDFAGETPLHTLSTRFVYDSRCPDCRKDLLALTEFFIRMGADVNAASEKAQNTPLHIAVNVHWNAPASADLARLFIAKGADVNAKNWRGDTPLHNVSSIDIAALLVDRGADVNAKNNKGMTPLHYVVISAGKYARAGKHLLEMTNKAIALAKFLISKGADVNAKDNKGKTLLALAREMGAEEMAALLRKYGARN